MKEKLMKILSVPIYPHELADPTEAVADYLLDNDVVPVVRCKNCDWYKEDECTHCGICVNPKCGKSWYGCPVPAEHFCSYGERRARE